MNTGLLVPVVLGLQRQLDVVHLCSAGATHGRGAKGGGHSSQYYDNDTPLQRTQVASLASKPQHDSFLFLESLRRELSHRRNVVECESQARVWLWSTTSIPRGWLTVKKRGAGQRASRRADQDNSKRSRARGLENQLCVFESIRKSCASPAVDGQARDHVHQQPGAAVVPRDRSPRHDQLGGGAVVVCRACTRARLRVDDSSAECTLLVGVPWLPTERPG